MTGEVYTYESSATPRSGGALAAEESYACCSTSGASSGQDGSYLGSVDMVLDAIVLAMTAARASFRAQQLMLSESSFQLLMASADKKCAAADKALVAGCVSGGATMAGGAVNLGFSAKAGCMLRADAKPPPNACTDYDMKTGSSIALERGRGVGTFGEGAGGVVSSIFTHGSARDEVEADRCDAEAQRVQGYADSAAGHGDDAASVRDKALSTSDEIRRSEHERNITAIT